MIVGGVAGAWYFTRDLTEAATVAIVTSTSVSQSGRPESDYLHQYDGKHIVDAGIRSGYAPIWTVFRHAT